MNFIIRWLVTAVAVGVAVWLVPGMELLGGTDAWVGIAIFSLILSLVNISIKPIMQVLSLPISVITLGIFYLVVNTLMPVSYTHLDVYKRQPRRRWFTCSMASGPSSPASRSPAAR